MKKILFVLVFMAAFAASGYFYQTSNAQGKPEFVPNQVLVKFDEGISPNEVAAAHRAVGASVKSEIPQLGVQVVEVDNVGAAIANYARNWRVEYAEPNYYAEALTDDTYFAKQWGFDNTGQETCNTAGDICTTGSADADIDAPEAWALATGNASVKVAVLDTGVNQGHPDLASKLVANIDFTGSGSIDDFYGHGTHTSGIAAAATNNITGVAGTGYNTSLVNVKVLNDSGSGAYSWIANGIVWAADHDAKVVSMSLGSSQKSNTLQNAVNYAWNKGVVLVAAAGNSNNPSRTYPAFYDKVIAVAATDNNDQKASFSSYGSWVDVAAPGVNVYSTFPTHAFTIQDLYGRSQNYDFGSGTSMSTPMVAGLAALIWDSQFGTSNQAVRDRIEQTADSVPGTGTYWTWGRVNACNAVGGNCTYDLGPVQTPAPSPTAEPSPSPTPNPDDALYCFKGVADGVCHPVKDSLMCSDCL